MKDTFREELIVALTPFVEHDRFEDMRMRVEMILSNYDIQRLETELTVYQGDVNEEILKRFLMAKIARGCTKRTVGYYKNSVKMALERIGKPYNEITADDIRLFLAIRVQQDGVSKTTANNERRNLSAFFTWLQKEEILLRNPMNKVESIKVAKAKKQAFTQTEIEKIRYGCVTCREEAMVEVLLSTWARVTEVTLIRIDEIKGNELVVHGKGEKDRTVYLNAKAMLAVERYLNERSDDNPYLFPRAKYAGDLSQIRKKGLTRNELKEWYKVPELVSEDECCSTSVIESTVRNIGKKVGVTNVHPHRFRRTGATNALRNGMPLLNVSKLLGHVNIGTTQIYLDISDAELEQAHERYVI